MPKTRSDGRVKKPKGKLDLRTKETAMKGGEEGKAIVPGNSAESTMVKLISLDSDDDDSMPGGENDTLSKEQIELITRWITEGAEWPEDYTVELPPEEKK